MKNNAPLKLFMSVTIASGYRFRKRLLIIICLQNYFFNTSIYGTTKILSHLTNRLGGLYKRALQMKIRFN